MKPLKLVMTAFGSYAQKQELDFTTLEEKNFFLITGPTGSGKTTILDAITFALYGTASGNLRENKSLRSDFALPSDKTEVSFTFLAKGKTYEVTRSPEQEIKKSRGEGTTSKLSAASLVEIVGDEKIPLASRINDVTGKIEEIIGFKAEQFRQIVLLPQGEFRKFLVANSDDRKKILETLFKTGAYSLIEAALKNKTSEINVEYTTLQNNIAAILNSVDASDSTAIKAKKEQLTKELASLKEDLKKLASESKTVAKKLQEAKVILSLFEEAKEAKEEFSEIAKEEKGYKEKEASLQHIEKAAALSEAFSAALNGKNKFFASQKALDTAKAVLTTCQKENTLLKSTIAKELGKATTEDFNFEDALTNLSEKMMDIASRSAALGAVNKELAKIASSLKDNEPCPVCGSLTHPNLACITSEQKSALAKQEEELKKETTKLQSLQRDFQSSQTTLATAQAEVSSCEKVLADDTTNFETTKATFKEGFEQSGFTSQEEFRNYLKLVASKDDLKEEIALFRETYAAKKDRVERAEKAIKGKTQLDTTNDENIFNTLTEKTNELNENIGAINNELELLTKAEEKLKKSQKELTTLEERYQTVALLSDTASGNNPSKISFSAYILQAILDDVLQTANLRLNKMSYGRYMLERTDEIIDGRKKAGLNLVILDTNTGVERSVTTLSGGEMFLASLSLALGLSDTLQAYAGGIHLDTLFIDEGFGGLDANALDMAIKTLLDLQKNGMLIGIISHVAELKDRIPTKLEITPTDHGSRAKFIV